MPESPPHQDAQRDVRTVSFVSLGCPKNLVDSEKMLGLLASDGLAPVSYNPQGQDDADAIVINTCGFLEASKEESLGVIREAIERKNRGEVRRVVVAGCLVQRHRAKLLEWAPGIDALIGVFDRDHIVEAVRGDGGGAAARLPIQADPERPKYWIAANALQAAGQRGIKTIGLTVNGKDGKGLGYFEDDSARLRLTPRHYAYLRISEGCNQNCAFCTIPSIRGKMRSKPLDRIAAEAEELIRDGVFELNLIGQDTTSYGDDIGAGYASDSDPWAGGLPLLLRTVNDAIATHAQGRGWARLMYAYPSNFSDGMIRALAELDHVVKYIDIPLQHASTRMLDLMRRRVTGRHQRELMLRLREMVPGVAIRTTMITGFPGETEDDHKELLEFIEEIGFDALGVFEYSREEGTRAGTMDADPALHVPAEVKARRHHEIMQLQQRIAFEQNEFIASDFNPENPLNSGHHFDILIDRSLDSRSRATPGLDAARGGVGGARLYRGRAYFQAPDIDAVTFVHSAKPRSPGDLVRCVIVASDGYDLIARPVDELA